MARTLKTYITDSGFYQLAVAAPSMKAALQAWEMKHNLFHQGLAHQTEDAAIIAAAEKQPGTVLRRPIGTKGAFKQTPDLPKVKPSKIRAVKSKPKIDRVALRRAEAALEKAQAAHRKRLHALDRAQAELDRRKDQEDLRFERERQKWQTRMDRAQRTK